MDQTLHLIIDSVLLAVYKNSNLHPDDHSGVIVGMLNSVLNIIELQYRERFVEILEETMTELIDVQETANEIGKIMKQLSW